jgi:hypothetical protein
MQEVSYRSEIFNKSNIDLALCGVQTAVLNPKLECDSNELTTMSANESRHIGRSDLQFYKTPSASNPLRRILADFHIY